MPDMRLLEPWTCDACGDPLPENTPQCPRCGNVHLDVLKAKAAKRESGREIVARTKEILARAKAQHPSQARAWFRGCTQYILIGDGRPHFGWTARIVDHQTVLKFTKLATREEALEAVYMAAGNIDWPVLSSRHCVHCGEANFSGYMVTPEVWQAAGMHHYGGTLHLVCLEERLGGEHPLTIDSFTKAPINNSIRFGYKLGRRQP